MTILNKQPLALAEVRAYIKDKDEKKQVLDYIKKFTKLKDNQATKLKEDIKALNNPKLKPEHIIKIVDLLPQDQEDLNKIVTEIGLSKEEADAIIQKLKEY